MLVLQNVMRPKLLEMSVLWDGSSVIHTKLALENAANYSVDIGLIRSLAGFCSCVLDSVG